MEGLLLTTQLFIIYLILVKYFYESKNVSEFNSFGSGSCKSNHTFLTFILVNATCLFSQELPYIHLLPRSHLQTCQQSNLCTVDISWKIFYTISAMKMASSFLIWMREKTTVQRKIAYRLNRKSSHIICLLFTCYLQFITF